MSKLTEYRCTRNSLYMHNCHGRDHISARQGHYVVACSPECAREAMANRFPADSHGFTAHDKGPADWPSAKCENCSHLDAVAGGGSR